MSRPRFVDIAELKLPSRTATQKNGNCKATPGAGTKQPMVLQWKLFF